MKAVNVNDMQINGRRSSIRRARYPQGVREVGGAIPSAAHPYRVGHAGLDKERK